MNIEEERKAFEKFGFPSPLIPVWLKFTDGGYTPLPEKQSIHSQKLSDHCNKLFILWLGAKEHAAEMAKPECVVFETIGGNFTVQTYDNKGTQNIRDFASQAGAIQWAKDNGYRVIE